MIAVDVGLTLFFAAGLTAGRRKATALLLGVGHGPPRSALGVGALLVLAACCRSTRCTGRCRSSPAASSTARSLAVVVGRGRRAVPAGREPVRGQPQRALRRSGHPGLQGLPAPAHRRRRHADHLPDRRGQRSASAGGPTRTRRAHAPWIEPRKPISKPTLIEPPDRASDRHAAAPWPARSRPADGGCVGGGGLVGLAGAADRGAASRSSATRPRRAGRSPRRAARCGRPPGPAPPGVVTRSPIAGAVAWNCWYSGCSYFRQHISRPHAPEIRIGFSGRSWSLAIRMVTGSKSVRNVAQHRSRPQEPMPPCTRAESRADSWRSSTRQRRVAPRSRTSARKSTRCGAVK